jgi:hypothetical protein
MNERSFIRRKLLHDGSLKTRVWNGAGSEHGSARYSIETIASGRVSAPSRFTDCPQAQAPRIVVAISRRTAHQRRQRQRSLSMRRNPSESRFVFEDADIRNALKCACERAGNQAAFANKHGISQAWASTTQCMGAVRSRRASLRRLNHLTEVANAPAFFAAAEPASSFPNSTAWHSMATRPEGDGNDHRSR